MVCPSVQHIDHYMFGIRLCILLVLETLLRCLLLKCWQVFLFCFGLLFFSALLQRRTAISAIHKASSPDLNVHAGVKLFKFKRVERFTGYRFETGNRGKGTSDKTTQISDLET